MATTISPRVALEPNSEPMFVAINCMNRTARPASLLLESNSLLIDSRFSLCGHFAQ
jgi:hypothetical protein